MTNTVSVEIDLARNLWKITFSGMEENWESLDLERVRYMRQTDENNLKSNNENINLNWQPI